MRLTIPVAVAALLGHGAYAQDAVDPRLAEAIRLEVERQLRGAEPSEVNQSIDGANVVAGVDISLLRQLVGEELDRRRAEFNPPIVSTPAAQPRMGLVVDDWHYIQRSGEGRSVREVSPRAAPFQSPAAPPRSALAGVAGAVTADNPVRPSNDALELLASANGAEATITLSTKEHAAGDLQGPRIETSSWRLTATAPLDKKSGEATFASLSGLANGFSLGGSWKFSSVPRQVNRETSAWTRVVSLKASTGFDDFTYFTSLSEREKDREMRWSLGASIGTSSPERKYYFGAGIDLQHAYKAQAPRVVCPLSTELTFECVQGAFGPPSSGYQRIAYVEARGSIMRRPVSLRVSHEFEEEITSADLPIYLLRNGDKFTGGLRFGWLSDDSEFLVGVFVGKEFGHP